MATVEGYKPVQKDDIIHERHNLNDYQTYHDGDFAYNLMTALTRFNFCQIIRSNMRRSSYKKDQGDFTIIGQRHNVEIVIYMYHYCLNNIKIMAEDGWKGYDRIATKIKTVYVRHFFDGAVNAIAARLYMQQKEMVKEHGAKMEVMVVNNKAAVNAKVNEMFSNLRTVASKSQRQSDAKSQGYQAGKSLNLAKGLDGGATAKRIG